jgi:hypothetical protein
MNREEALNELNNIDVSKFGQWNTTSLEYIIGFATGYLGSDIRERSLQIYQQFIDWYRDYSITHIRIPVYDFARSSDDLINIQKLLLSFDQSQFTDNEKNNLSIVIKFMNRIDP